MIIVCISIILKLSFLYGPDDTLFTITNTSQTIYDIITIINVPLTFKWYRKVVPL